MLEWKTQVHIDQQAKWNGKKRQSITLLPLHASNFLCPLLPLTHTHQRYWYVCAFQSSPHRREHGYWTLDTINHSPVTDLVCQSSAARYITFGKIFSCIFNGVWSSQLFCSCTICIFSPCTVSIDWFVKQTAENPPGDDPVCRVNEEIAILVLLHLFFHVTWCKSSIRNRIRIWPSDQYMCTTKINWFFGFVSSSAHFSRDQVQANMPLGKVQAGQNVPYSWLLTVGK